jgi:hypothetical protein
MGDYPVPGPKIDPMHMYVRISGWIFTVILSISTFPTTCISTNISGIYCHHIFYCLVLAQTQWTAQCQQKVQKLVNVSKNFCTASCAIRVWFRHRWTSHSDSYHPCNWTAGQAQKTLDNFYRMCPELIGFFKGYYNYVFIRQVCNFSERETNVAAWGRRCLYPAPCYPKPVLLFVCTGTARRYFIF